jgi:hypothetical protein
MPVSTVGIAAVDATNFNGTGGLVLPSGTTAQRPVGAPSGLVRFNTDTQSQEMFITGTGWSSQGARDGSSAGRAALKSTDIKLLNPSAPTGWYWLQINGIATQVYVDMDYDGGGWVLVGTHPINIALVNPTYAQTTTGLVQIGTAGFTVGSGDPKQFATWAPLARWRFIAQANGTGNTVVYFTAASQVELGATGSHSRRSRWTWTGWSATYAWQGLGGLVNEVGGTTPGLYSYHAANGYSWTTFDVDQDAAGSNCAANYQGAPMWYGACWDGSFWGGGQGGNGHSNAAYWTSSTTDFYNYGAIYVR